MTGGVVRRDGLREAVGRWLYERDWSGDIEGWDDPDTDRDEYLDQADDLISRVLDAVPDVSPDQPAVDLAGRDGSSFVTADDLHDAFCEFGHQCQMHDLCQAREGARHVADALNLRAADVRARALEDAADALEADHPLAYHPWLRDRAVSEREGDGS